MAQNNNDFEDNLEKKFWWKEEEAENQEVDLEELEWKRQEEKHARFHFRSRLTPRVIDKRFRKAVKRFKQKIR